MRHSTPTSDTIKQFQCAGDVRRLLGGEGKVVRVGDCVFKPVDNPERYSWGCELLSRLPGNGYRIAKPLRTTDAAFVHQRWGASTFEPGQDVSGRWQEKLEISRRFHSELNALRPTSMPPSSDRWTQAHEIAWQVEPIPTALPALIIERIERIFARYRPLSRGSTVVHSDLCGNILFHDDLDPCIIDFSPTYGSFEYAQAILVADAIAWEGAPVEIVKLISEDDAYGQSLLRAINFRVIVAALYWANQPDRFWDKYTAFEPILRLKLGGG